MKKEIIITIIILIVVLIIFNLNFINEKNSTQKICFQKNCFNVEVASNEEGRSRGLMFRKNLCNNCGMLFIFEEEGNYKFWMKNTLMNLDIIWMDEDLRVQYIISAKPCIVRECELYGFSEDMKSKYVLEVNSGVAQRIGLVVGKKMVLV